MYIPQGEWDCLIRYMGIVLADFPLMCGFIMVQVHIIIPSKVRFLLGVPSNVYGFENYRFRVQNWHWPFRYSTHFLQLSYPLSNRQLLPDSQGGNTQFYPCYNFRVPRKYRFTLSWILLHLNNNLIAYSTTRPATQLRFSSNIEWTYRVNKIRRGEKHLHLQILTEASLFVSVLHYQRCIKMLPTYDNCLSFIRGLKL